MNQIQNCICLSSNTSWYLYNFRSSTIKALKAANYRVVCLSPADDYSQKLVSELGCIWEPLKIDNEGTNPLKDVSLIFRFLALYRKYRPKAALHFTIKNNVYGTWAARLLGIPSINNVSGLGTAFIHTGIVSRIVRLLYKTSFPLASHVFCQNQEDYDLLVSQRLVPKEKLQQLPGSGVDTCRFDPKLKSKNTTPYIFLYAGRMLADKGLRELVEAMSRLAASQAECELWLVGFTDVKNKTAISREELDSWCEAPNIKYLGSTDEMEQVMAQADCVVLPSYREGMPRSLLEAGAMGLPSVTTDVPGCRNIIEHGFNGLLCEAKDVDSLFDALSAMLEVSENDREVLGRNAREHVVAEYSEQKVIDLTLAAINSVSA